MNNIDLFYFYYYQNTELLPEGLFNDEEDDITLIEISSHITGDSVSQSKSNWYSHETKNPLSNLTAKGVRILNFFKPPSTTMNMITDRRQIKSSLDHTIFIYPTSFEKFDQRYVVGTCDNLFIYFYIFIYHIYTLLLKYIHAHITTFSYSCIIILLRVVYGYIMII